MGFGPWGFESLRPHCPTPPTRPPEARRPLLQRRDHPDAQKLLPRAHRAVSNLKTWLQGTGVSPEHLQSYLDEFVFRHNRRRTPTAAFQTLLGLGTRHGPTTYLQIADRAADSFAEQTG